MSCRSRSKARLEGQGYEVAGSDSDAFRALLVREDERWARLAKVLNVQVD